MQQKICGLTLLMLVFVIVDERSFVSTSKIQLAPEEESGKVDKVFARDIINTSGKEIESGRQRRYFINDFFWDESPRLMSINAFHLTLLAVIVMVVLG